MTHTEVLPGQVAAPGSRAPTCRFCGSALSNVVVDPGTLPLCERYLAAAQLDEMESFYPLRVLVCDDCLLVQLQQYVRPEEIFTEYAYFSSYSTSWVEHAPLLRRQQAAHAMVAAVGLREHVADQRGAQEAEAVPDGAQLGQRHVAVDHQHRAVGLPGDRDRVRDGQ